MYSYIFLTDTQNLPKIFNIYNPTDRCDDFSKRLEEHGIKNAKIQYTTFPNQCLHNECLLLTLSDSLTFFASCIQDPLNIPLIIKYAEDRHRHHERIELGWYQHPESQIS
jgi:hypothetical protein